MGDEKRGIPPDPRTVHFILKTQGRWGGEQKLTVNHRGLLGDEANNEDVNTAAIKAVEQFKGLLDEFRGLPVGEAEPPDVGPRVPQSGAEPLPDSEAGSE
jgi:hypothetical protein